MGKVIFLPPEGKDKWAVISRRSVKNKSDKIQPDHDLFSCKVHKRERLSFTIIRQMIKYEEYVEELRLHLQLPNVDIFSWKLGMYQLNCHSSYQCFGSGYVLSGSGSRFFSQSGSK